MQLPASALMLGHLFFWKFRGGAMAEKYCVDIFFFLNHLSVKSVESIWLKSIIKDMKIC